MEVAITNLGAKVLQIVVPDRHGAMDDVALGYDSLDAVLSDDNALVIEHLATALDEPGPASFTSHIYFNLDGVGEGQTIDGHVLQVPEANDVLATGPDGIATGERISLHGHVHDLRSEASGRTLDVWTTEPLLQVYTAGQLGVGEKPDVGKQGVRHRPRCAVCLEPQWFPNAPNCPTLPQNLVAPGRPYRGTTVYRFGVS